MNQEQNTACEIAEAAQELIRSPKDFCQNAYARDADGAIVDVHSDEAVKFCAVGALRRVTEQQMGLKLNTPSVTKVFTALGRAAREYSNRTHDPLLMGNAAVINDKMGHEAVMDLYDRVRELVCP